MEQDFYRDRLEKMHGIEVIVPEAPDREIVHRVIYEELCLGTIDERSRAEYRRIIGKLVASGAEGVILGCTEISLLVNAADAPVPLFDTTAVHARSAAEWSLS
jgi:aspartate racemase